MKNPQPTAIQRAIPEVVGCFVVQDSSVPSVGSVQCMTNRREKLCLAQGL